MSRKTAPSRKNAYQEVTALARLASRLGAAQKSSSRQLLTPSEVARMLKVSRGLVYTWMHRGDLASVSFGRVRRIRADDLDRFVEERWLDSSLPGAERAASGRMGREKTEPGEGRLTKWRREHGES